jgi:hypothetical protein
MLLPFIVMRALLMATSLVYDATLVVPLSQDLEASSSFLKVHVQQDRHYEKEGKRWVRRRDNCKRVRDSIVINHKPNISLFF